MVFVLQILRHYLTKEGRVSKLFCCLIRMKGPCVRKSEWLTRSKILGILQTEMLHVKSIQNLCLGEKDTPFITAFGLL